MKKLIVSIMMALFSMNGYSQTIGNVPFWIPINFSVNIIAHGQYPISRPRTPIQAPEAGLDGHTLYLAEGHPACTLLLMDADEEAVYEVDVPEGVDVVELPATLTGIYELQLYYEDSNFYFYSEIEL